MAEAPNEIIAQSADGLDEARLIDDAGQSERVGRIAAPVLRYLGFRLVRGEDLLGRRSDGADHGGAS